MKTVAIIGSGPSGLLVANYLANYMKINIYEASNKILGHYNYSLNIKKSLFENILKNKNINLFLNTKITDLTTINADAIILATGGIAKSINGTKTALDIIKQYDHNQDVNIGKNICIIGAGNVAMDLLLRLKNKLSTATVISSTDLFNSKFTNNKLRNIKDYYQITTNIYNINDLQPKNNEDIRRLHIIKKINNNINNPKISFIFNGTVKQITDNKVTYLSNGETVEKIFTDIISSIGFIPNINVNTNTVNNVPVYKIGWCNKPMGNIASLRINAQILADQIKTVLLK